MKKLEIAFASIVMISTFACKPLENTGSGVLLIGGTSATDDSTYAKSTVKLVIRVANGTNYCTGTIVGPNNIITAAHCFDQQGRVTAIQHGSSAKDVQGISDIRNHIHPSYDDRQLSDDLAVVTFTGTLPDPLAPVTIGTSDYVKPGAAITYSAYGVREDGSRTTDDPLQIVKTTIETVNDSAKKFVDLGNSLTHCGGDSGGPVYSETKGILQLVGVISAGSSASCQNGKGINIKVPEYQGWMKCSYEAMGAAVESLIEDSSSSVCDTQDIANSSGSGFDAGAGNGNDQDFGAGTDQKGDASGIFHGELPPEYANLPICLEHDASGNCSRFQ